jgi:hypothetical protein
MMERIITNTERMLIKDINQLPFPDRNKIALQKYFDAWKKKHGISMLNVSTMRDALIPASGAAGRFTAAVTAGEIRNL